MAARIWSTLTLLNALSGVSAFWRMECRGRVGLARIDPLMDEGEASSHAHTIHGSSGFGESATFDDLTAGNCTSCAVDQDLSAYWTPPMYFAFSNGTFEIVPQVGGMLSYYLLRDPNDDVKGFPNGFRMISGNTNRRSYTLGNVSEPDPDQSSWEALGQTTQADLVQRAVGFNCLDYSKTPEASLYRHFLPSKDYLDANCPDGIRLELAFPSCWNGKDLDSDDHQSHVAYPDLVQDGNCPDGFDVRLVTLFYETIWNTAAFQDEDGFFVIANGDPTGFGYHGDFMTGWEEDFLQSAVDTCTNQSGLISDCPLFTIQDEATQNECKLETLPTELKMENVVDELTALPGNVQIQYGPEDATAGAGATSAAEIASTYSAPSLTYKSASTSYPGGGVFIETSLSSSSATAVAAPSIEAVPEASTVVTTSAAPPTTTAAPTSASDPNVSYEVVSTEIRTEGGRVQQIVWEEAVVYVTEDVVTTVTVSPASKSEHQKERRSHLWRHRHHGLR
ncbi:hypothetical protein BJ170DRAFT_118091 [Xylariales sp. AK1849]|nr:hypothetical protein BJ170DRAFT_118091 [Xylariales sp. AK1849]